MTDDDDDLNDFKLPPHTNEDADAQLDAKAIKLVREYVGSLNRSKNENTIRGGIRETIVKLGINSLSFQHELTAQKMMTPEDRRDYMAGRRRMGRILATEPGMFAEEQELIKKRKAKAKEKAAKAAAAAGKETPEAQERRIAADSNPRSDPKNGGAGKKRGRPPKKPAGSAADRAIETSGRNQRLAEVQTSSAGAEPQETGDQLIARVAAEKNAELEQREGTTILDGAIDRMTEKPLSQSAQVAAINEKLGLA